LTDLLVFGARAGRYAAEHAQSNTDLPKIDEEQLQRIEQIALAHFDPEGRENPYSVISDLQGTMEIKAGIVRARGELEEGLEALQTLKERAQKVRVEGNRQYNPGWHYALDLRNMLCIAEAIALSALHREESRGGHTREDFPDSSTAFQKVNTVITEKDGEMVLEQRQGEAMPDHLSELLKLN
jgi:succinate dehydrogenase / fumarate reductase flavoprotein subunit